MPLQKYANYLEVNPLFESVVDIGADQRNPDLWKEYIVGDDMCRLVDFLCQSLGNEAVDARRSFWVHGSYGTGKSYAAIFVKHLLEEKPQVVNDFMQRHQLLSPYRNRFMKLREKGDYLVIWKTGCTGIRDGAALLMEAEQAVRQALIDRFGDNAFLGAGSLKQAVQDKLQDEMINWTAVLDNTTLGDDYASLADLRDKAAAGDIKALTRTAAVIRENGWGLINSLDTFKAWLGEVIEENGLSKGGIFFIWDEFTEYLYHGEDLEVLQQLSEFCKIKPFFMLFVFHRSEEMMASFGKDKYDKIVGRFHAAEFHISADASFDLIAGSFSPRPGMDEHWKDARAAVLRDFKPCLPDMTGLDDKLAESIDRLCPMHPMTIKLLARVAESYAAAQRTLFRFMKDQSVPDQGFIGYINKYGPDDQVRWLTPEWLWDYFFTRESDFSDKDTKAAEFIRHYEESRHLVESDENTLRVFKVAMLLLAVMSSTKGVYGTARAQGGISATVECLKNCLAGTMDAAMVDDKLDLLQDNKLVNRDTYGSTTRLQLPYKALAGVEFDKRLADNDKRYTRYQMFGRDGAFALLLEERALDQNDAMSKRIKAVACCAETQSIKNRLEEIDKELAKAPYKLGLLLVTVKDNAQAIAIQGELKRLAEEGSERLVVALLRSPFTDDKRKEWLTRMTNMELANEGGQTKSAKQFETEMNQIVNTWVSQAVSGTITAWHGTREFSNQYGTANLRKTISTSVRQELFPYAPEAVVATSTAYKTCSEPAVQAGISRNTNNSQLKNVLESLKMAGLLDAADIGDLAQRDGGSAVKAVAALARLVQERMGTGKANLSDLWEELQRPPFGYYDTIACGILLGFVFSFYKDSRYSWTDSAQSTHVLGEATLKTLVLDMCKGRLTTDYLSEGTVEFRHFRDYVQAFFGLADVQAANETECWRNLREAITKSGAPLWALKYLDEGAYLNPAMREGTLQVVDALQRYVMAEQGREGLMSDVLELMKGRGKVKPIIQKAFQDKSTLAGAFRRFLYQASPELQAIAEKLSIQPEPLNDKLHQVMQAAIYTWTEDQVKEKLGAVVQEYLYLDALNTVIGKNCHDMAEAKKELANLFGFFRLSMEALEKLNLPWFGTLKMLRRVARDGNAQLSAEEQRADLLLMSQWGKEAMSALKDAKPVLSQLLLSRGLECSREELDTVYSGLKDLTCDSPIGTFDNTLKTQTNNITMARNRLELQSRWTILTGEESAKSWCVSHNAPIRWIVPKESAKAIETVIDLQHNRRALDTAVVTALQTLGSLDVGLMTDDNRITAALISRLGTEYQELWQAEGPELINTGRQKWGSDMSEWSMDELIQMQRMLKGAQQEKAKREKLAAAKAGVQRMAESSLRSRIAAFLDKHPEFCDSFME